MKFDSDIGKLQRLMAESIAGTSRRSAILSEMRIQPGNTIIDVGCGAGHLLPHLAKAVGGSGTIYGLDPTTDQMEQAKKRCADFQNIIFLEENADKVQGLEMNGVAPTYENIASFAYPGARPLYVYAKKAHLDAIPGLREYLLQWTKMWDKDGELAKIGLVASPADVMAANLKAATEYTTLDGAQLK